MTKPRIIALLVVIAHWMIAIWHLFLTAKILPAPNNTVSWPGIMFITLGHLLMSIVLWKLSDKVSGVVSLLFFLVVGAADVYEHFVHPALNNVFMVRPGNWTTLWEVSVFGLLAFEILGCALGILLLAGRRGNDRESQASNHSIAS
jgi:hypothetical protein